MKRILEIGVYKPGDLTDEVINLDDFKANIKGNSVVFTGYATVKSRSKGRTSAGFTNLAKSMRSSGSIGRLSHREQHG